MTRKDGVWSYQMEGVEIRARSLDELVRALVKLGILEDGEGGLA